MVIDVSFVYLKQILSDKQIEEVYEYLRGCRLYVPIKEYEYKKELRIYNHAISIGYTKEEAIQAVANNFNKSKITIAKNIQRSLFDES